MTTDLYKGHNQSDGEGIVYSDMNDMVRFTRAALLDQIVQSMIGDHSLTGGADPQYGGARGADAPSHLAYTLHGGQAYLRQGSANNKLQVAPGTLLQKIANADGNDATLIPYTFVGTEEVAIAAGGGVNPRVDLVQMKLEWITTDLQARSFKDATTGAVTTPSLNKKKRVQCTLSVKSGTAAASPQVPDPDAGFVALATVVVGTSYAIGTALVFGVDTAGNVAVVHDQRMPIGVMSIPVGAVDFMGAWSLNASKTAITSGVIGNTAFCLCPVEGTGRIVGLGIYKDNSVALTTPRIGQIIGTGGAAQPMLMNATSMACAITPPAAGVDVVEVPYYSFEANHFPLAGPTVLPSTTNKIGVPMWANGKRCPVPKAQGSGTGISFAGFFVGSTSAVQLISAVRWSVAVGL